MSDWCRFLCACGCGQRCACDCMDDPAYRKLADNCRRVAGKDGDGWADSNGRLLMPVAHSDRAGVPMAAQHPGQSIPCDAADCVLALGHRIPHRPSPAP